MTEMLRTCSAIILDFDGTIVDSNIVKRRCFAEIFCDKSFSQRELFDFIDSLGSVDRFEIISACSQVFFEGAYSAAEIKGKIDLYSESCHKNILDADEIAGSLAFIRKAKESDKLLFISSATPQQYLVPVVDALGLSEYFNEIYGGPESKFSHIERVMVDNSLRSEDIAYIGDSDDDYNAASQCGCHFFGIVSQASRFSIDPAELHYGFHELIRVL